MDPEHHTPSNEPTPTSPEPERAELHPDGPPKHLRPGPETARVAEVVLDQLHGSDAKLRIVEGLLSYGTPFAAYLTLPDVAAKDPTIVDQFGDHYADSWEDLNDYLDDLIEGQGWHDALAEFRSSQGVSEDLLDWNRDALLAHARQMFDLVPLDGWWHLFAK